MERLRVAPTSSCWTATASPARWRALSHTPAHVEHVADVNTATSHGDVGPVEVGPVELLGQHVEPTLVGRRARPPALDDDGHGHRHGHQHDDE